MFCFNQILKIIVAHSIFNIDFFDLQFIHTIFNYGIFEQRNCFRFTNTVNNTTKMNTFNIDDNNINKIKTPHC